MTELISLTRISTERFQRNGAFWTDVIHQLCKLSAKFHLLRPQSHVSDTRDKGHSSATFLWKLCGLCFIFTTSISLTEEHHRYFLDSSSYITFSCLALHQTLSDELGASALQRRSVTLSHGIC